MDFRIGAINNFDFMPEVAKPVTPEKPTGVNPFSTFFDAALNLFEETNALQISAENLQIDLATGRTDDILTVLLAQDRAYNALNFTIQVTNKIIESYREIMRMQV